MSYAEQQNLSFFERVTKFYCVWTSFVYIGLQEINI